MTQKFYLPPIDTYCTKTEYKFFASIPEATDAIIGLTVDPNGREITVLGDLLLPKEFKGLSPLELSNVLVRLERPSGKFERIFKVPGFDEVNWHGIKTAFDNGVFCVDFAKGGGPRSWAWNNYSGERYF